MLLKQRNQAKQKPKLLVSQNGKEKHMPCFTDKELQKRKKVQNLL